MALRRSSILRLLAGVVLAAALSAPTTQAGFKEGVAAYEAGDYATALREMRPLAEQGDALAQVNLGLMYHKGQGVPQDYVEAHMWSNLAAAQGNEKAKTNRDIIAKKMTPQDISEAQKRARVWKPCGKDRPCP